MGLVFRYGRKRVPATGGCDDTSCQLNHPTLITNLLRSIDSAKDLLDSFLQISPGEYNYLPLSEWHRIILATFVTYKLSFGLPKVANWNFDAARETLDLETYLRSLIDHIEAGRVETPSGTESGCSLFFMILDILESVKLSYATARDYPYLFSDGIRAHRDLGATTESHSIGTRKGSRCPGFQYLPRQRNSLDTSSLGNSALDSGVIAELQLVESEMWRVGGYAQNTA
jgi:hypothetical protein